MKDESTLVQETGIKQGNLSRDQYNYAVARALYDQRLAAYHAESIATVRPLDRDRGSDIDRFLAEDGEIFTRHRVQEALDILIKAEDALIEWADKCARRNLGKQRYRQIEEVFKCAGGQGMKQKLIDICMKMRAERRAG